MASQKLLDLMRAKAPAAVIVDAAEEAGYPADRLPLLRKMAERPAGSTESQAVASFLSQPVVHHLRAWAIHG